MSYILDALRRADAERERGHVPGLHAQGASKPLDLARPPAWRAGLIGLGAGAAVVLLALAVWQGGRIDDAGPSPPAAAVRTTSSPPPMPTVPPVVTPVAPPPAIAIPAPTASAPVPSGVAARSVARVPAAVPPPNSRKSAAPTVATSAASPPSETGVTGAAGAERATPGAAAASPVSTLAELPEDIRRQLPALTVGGSAYSSSAASRFVIVNGQLFREGDALAPGLVLEQIRLKSAVLAFKGYRYGISF